MMDDLGEMSGFRVKEEPHDHYTDDQNTRGSVTNDVINATAQRLVNIQIKEDPDRLDSVSDIDDKTHLKRFLSGTDEGVNTDGQKKFNTLVTKAKQCSGDGNLREAITLYKQALEIYHSEKLEKRISKMEAYLSSVANEEDDEDGNDEDDGDMVHLGKNFYLYKDLYKNLYRHQKEGVLWMWTLHQKRKGGILGDDMGLGKTIQVISFLSGMFDADKIQNALIVMPVSLIATWETEFDKWAPGIRVSAFHGTSKRERERVLARVQRRGGVCITTYGMVVSSWEQLGKQDYRDFTWDYVILDEGHKIKNPTKTSKGIHAVAAHNRLILTGTAVQNNLKELWALFDFVHHGQLLGTSRTFKMEYENPITRAREKDATVGERRLGGEMSESLRRIIAPYFLRRTKAEIIEEDKENVEPTENVVKNEIKMPSLTRKNDLILWIYLSETQQAIYQDFLSLDDVKELLMTKKSPLVALTVLKKICDHPRLLSTRACAKLGLHTDHRLKQEDLEMDEGLAKECAANRITHIPDDILIGESGKMLLLFKLLDNLRKEGHRCLVFSQSRKILDVIQRVLSNKEYKVARLDGTVTLPCEREQIIKRFQKDTSYSVFLLTTQVGGVGLTLTAADRVVIYDPSWNPAVDAQAVDRVFRIGQNKNVVIYRLITCGTVEEKIYRRQVFKDSITRQTTGNSKNPYRYFSQTELRELFTMGDPRCSTTQQQLSELHGQMRVSDAELDKHINFLHTLDMFGVSDHDLMFSNTPQDDDQEDDPGQAAVIGTDYIQSRVQKAQDLLKMESSLSQEAREQLVQQYKRPPLEGRTIPRQITEWTGPKPDIKPVVSRPPQVYNRPPLLSAIADVTVISDADDDDDDVIPASPVSTNHHGDDNDDVIVVGSPSAISNSSVYEVIDEQMSDLSIHEISQEEKSDTHHIRSTLPMKGMVDKNSNKEASILGREDITCVHSGHKNDEEIAKETDHAMLEIKPDVKPEIKPEVKAENMFKSPSLNIVSARTHITPKHYLTPKLSRITSPAAQTPKTPSQRIVEEELFISPDGSKPLMSTTPKSTSPRRCLGTPRNRFGQRTPLANLNSTLFSNEDNSASPIGNKSGHLNDALFTTVVQDSPDPGSYAVSVASGPPNQNSGTPFVIDSVDNTPVLADISNDSLTMQHNAVTESPIVNSHVEATPESGDSIVCAETDSEGEEISRNQVYRRSHKRTNSLVSDSPMVPKTSSSKRAARKRIISSDEDEDDDINDNEDNKDDKESDDDDDETNKHDDVDAVSKVSSICDNDTDVKDDNSDEEIDNECDNDNNINVINENMDISKDEKRIKPVHISASDDDDSHDSCVSEDDGDAESSKDDSDSLTDRHTDNSAINDSVCNDSAVDKSHDVGDTEANDMSVAASVNDMSVAASVNDMSVSASVDDEETGVKDDLDDDEEDDVNSVTGIQEKSNKGNAAELIDDFIVDDDDGEDDEDDDYCNDQEEEADKVDASWADKTNGDDVDNDDDDDDDESNKENDEDDDEEDDDDMEASLSEDKQQEFDSFVNQTRVLYKAGNYEDALMTVLQALDIKKDQTLQTLAMKINAKLNAQ